jgi:hypothetical protein
MWNLTRVEVQLCNLLSPEGPQVSLESFNWGLVSIFLLSLSNHLSTRNLRVGLKILYY